MPRRKATELEVAEVRGALSAMVTVPGWQISARGANRLQSFLEGTAVSFWWDDDDETDEEQTYEVTPEGVAIIPIHGTIIDSPHTWWSRYLGYCSTPQITDWAKAAAVDANVKDVFLDIDSPGGMVGGLAAAADAIYAIRATGKRVWAGCREMCSAAWHLGSQSDRIFVTRDGTAGCMGVVIGIGDWSKYYAAMGVEKLRITNKNGATYKGAGMMGTEITPEHRDDLARICDEYQGIFDENVARGRGISLEAAQALADGRYFIGANAVAMGFADEILDVQDALTRMGADRDSDGALKPAPTPEPVPGSNRAKAAADSGGVAPRHTKGKLSMTWKEFKSLFQGGETEDDTQPGATNPAPAPAAQPAPIAPAAAATTDRYKAFHDQELATAKAKAEATAVTAFGQNAEALARAKATIERQDDVQAVRDLASGYEDLIPENLRGNGQRQSQGAAESEGTNASNNSTKPVPSASALTADEIKAAQDRARKLQGKSNSARVAAGRGQ